MSYHNENILSKIAPPFTNSDNISQMPSPPPEHCWGFSSVYFNGSWHTPDAPWLVDANAIDPSINQNYGPWGIADLPGLPGPPPSPGCCGSGTFSHSFTNDPVFRSNASDVVYNWVVSNVGPISIGDTVILEMQGVPMISQPFFLPGSPFAGLNVITKYCLKYEGIQTDWTNTWSHWDVGDHIINCPASSDCSCNPQFDCLDCEVVVIDGGPNLVFAHPTLGINTTISHPEIPSGGGELAKLGDTIWIKEAQSGTWSSAGDTGSYSYHLKEFTIDSNCSLTHVRDIPIPYMVSTGASMCAATLMASNWHRICVC